MYGKKRVVINKRNQIIIAGKTEGSKGGSWIPIGKITKFPNTKNVVAKFLRPENRFESKLTDDNSITMGGMTVNNIRKAIKSLYKIP